MPNELRRRGGGDPAEFDYRRGLELLANFVDNELGNGRRPRQRPNDDEWRRQRAKTIRALNELREKLDKICVAANYGKAVGNSAEILGAGGEIVGAVMSLAGLPSAKTVMNIGSLVYNSGTLIDGISVVVEVLGTTKYLSDIEEVLEKDKALAVPLSEWLDFSANLDANVQEIFGVSLASERWNLVTKAFLEFAKFTNTARSFDATLSLMRQGKYSVYIGNDVKLEKLRRFFGEMSACPRFADRIRVTLSVLSVSTTGIQVVREGARAYRSLLGISNSAVIPTLQGGLNPEVPTAGAVGGFTFFKALSLAMGIISLVNAVNIIKHGTSKYSDALKELTRSLAWELRRMEEL